MTQPRLKHFGWGREGEGLTPAEEAFVLGRIEQLFGPWPRAKSNRRGWRTSSSHRPGSIHRHRCRSARPRSMTARHIPTANHSPIMSAGWSATTATRRTWLPIRVLRRRSRRCSTGRAAPRRA